MEERLPRGRGKKVGVAGGALLLLLAAGPSGRAAIPPATTLGATSAVPDSCLIRTAMQRGASAETARALAELSGEVLLALDRTALADRICSYSEATALSTRGAEAMARSLTRSYDWIHQSELRTAQQRGEPYTTCTAACFSTTDALLELAQRAFSVGLNQLRDGGFALALYNTLWHGCLDELSRCLEAC